MPKSSLYGAQRPMLALKILVKTIKQISVVYFEMLLTSDKQVSSINNGELARIELH